MEKKTFKISDFSSDSTKSHLTLNQSLVSAPSLKTSSKRFNWNHMVWKKTNLDFSTSPIFGSTCSPATSNQPGSSSGLKKSMAIDCNRDDTSGGSRIINYDPPTKIIHYDPPRRIIHYDPPTRMIIYGPPGGSCEASLATFLPSSSFSSGILCSPMIQWRYF